MYRNLSRRLAALSRSARAAAAATVSALTSPTPPAPAPAPGLESCTCPPPLPALAQDLPAGRHDDILPLLAVRCSRMARGDNGGDAMVARRMMGSAPSSRLGGERRTREDLWGESALRALPRPPLRVELAGDAAVSSLRRRSWPAPPEASLRSELLRAVSGVPHWVLALALALLPLPRRRLPLELAGLLAERSGLLVLALDAEADAAVAAESLRLRRVRLPASLLPAVPAVPPPPPPPPGERPPPPPGGVALFPLPAGDDALLALPARRRPGNREPLLSAEP